MTLENHVGTRNFLDVKNVFIGMSPWSICLGMFWMVGAAKMIVLNALSVSLSVSDSLISVYCSVPLGQ